MRFAKNCHPVYPIIKGIIYRLRKEEANALMLVHFIDKEGRKLNIKPRKEIKTSDILSPEFQKQFNPDHSLAKLGIFPLVPIISTMSLSGTCFAKGTKIALFDGSEKPVETIVPATPADPSGGDMLLSVDGLKTYVTAVIAGPRLEPIVKISAKSIAPEFPNKKFKIAVSMNHCIAVDYLRVLHAWFLRVGDHICTKYGRAIIEKIDLIDYDEDVWNVYLASSNFIKNVLPNLTTERLYYHLTNSSLGLTPKQHLILGNGILSGDLYVQIQSQDLARMGLSLNLFV
ncbi:MAG: hypothetical protein ACE5OZ_00995 [Candidatus Heimdallarchaeota archaeon]